mmetsp:Transcript_8740/g.14513  ORF Transcript_8740/g.14513 Transcript_8740/m.14513 type:complete len:216 (-) Transcript_8740:83-730(-)
MIGSILSSKAMWRALLLFTSIPPLTLRVSRAPSNPDAPSIESTFPSRPRAPSIIMFVFCISGSICRCSSSCFSARALASRSSRCFFSVSARFFALLFFSAAPTRASPRRDRSSFFFPPFFFITGALTLPPDPSSASSAASMSAFSSRLRAASSAFAAASVARDCPLVLAPCCQSLEVSASRAAASRADTSAACTAFFSFPATALAFGLLGPIVNE